MWKFCAHLLFECLMYRKGLELLPRFASIFRRSFDSAGLQTNCNNVNLTLNLCCILLNVVTVLYIRRHLLYTVGTHTNVNV